MRPVLFVNGAPVPAGPRYQPPPPLGPPQRPGCLPSCCGELGSDNGGHREDRPAHGPGCEYAPAGRIFDHLDGTEPETRRFSAVARAMRAQPAWWTVPEDAPLAAVAGELTTGGQP